MIATRIGLFLVLLVLAAAVSATEQRQPPSPIMSSVAAFDRRYTPGDVVAGFMDRIQQGGCALDYSHVQPVLESDPEDEHPPYAFGSYPFEEKWTCDGKPYVCRGYVSMDGPQPRFLFLSVNYSAQKLW